MANLKSIPLDGVSSKLCNRKKNGPNCDQLTIPFSLTGDFPRVYAPTQGWISKILFGATLIKKNINRGGYI